MDVPAGSDTARAAGHLDKKARERARRTEGKEERPLGRRFTLPQTRKRRATKKMQRLKRDVPNKQTRKGEHK